MKKAKFVIVNKSGHFFTRPGWSSEYPNAAQYDTLVSAYSAATLLAEQYPTQIRVIQNYGEADEELRGTFTPSATAKPSMCLQLDAISGDACNQPAFGEDLCQRHLEEEIAIQRIAISDLSDRMLFHNRRLSSLEKAQVDALFSER